MRLRISIFWLTTVPTILWAVTRKPLASWPTITKTCTTLPALTSGLLFPSSRMPMSRGKYCIHWQKILNPIVYLLCLLSGLFCRFYQKKKRIKNPPWPWLTSSRRRIRIWTSWTLAGADFKLKNYVRNTRSIRQLQNQRPRKESLWALVRATTVKKIVINFGPSTKCDFRPQSHIR